MRRLVNYIIYVFFPTYMDVKYLSGFEFGPTHLLSEIRRIRENCLVEERAVLEAIVSWNTFFAHQENIQVY